MVERWADVRRTLGISSRQPLFCTLPGGSPNPSCVRQLLTRLAARAGIDKRVHAHGLRHTQAELAEKGYLVNFIQDQLGHASLAVTDRYLRHVAPRRVSKPSNGGNAVCRPTAAFGVSFGLGVGREPGGSGGRRRTGRRCRSITRAGQPCGAIFRWREPLCRHRARPCLSLGAEPLFGAPQDREAPVLMGIRRGFIASRFRADRWRGWLEKAALSGFVLYYHQDQLGSTRALTDRAGAVVATYTYDPYGKLTASTGSANNPFGYAGQYTDQESGLQYLRARYYDPGTAQFITVDPAYTLTASRYGYTNGSPLNATDPTGLYDYTYREDIGPISQFGSATDVMSLFERNFKQVFPFSITDCSDLRDEAICTLHALPTILHGVGLVEVENLTPSAFSFRVVGGGYFDETGSMITISTCEQGGDVFLQQHGQSSGTHGYGPLDSLADALIPTGAKGVWATQASNLRNLIYQLKGLSLNPWTYGVHFSPGQTPPASFPGT